MSTKEKVKTIGYILIAIAVLIAFVYVMYTYVYPWSLTAERRAVEHSDSFVDSTNIAMMNFIAQYEGTENEAQKKTIFQQICLKYATVPPETVNAGIVQWIFQNGGCTR